MDLQEIKKIDAEHFLPVFGERFDQIFTHGEGVYLYDTDGKKYTDFLAGIAVNCLGYNDKGLVDTISTQAKKLIHISNYFYNETQSLLTKLLCEKTGLDRVFLSNSGAEANEGAIKIAKNYFFKKGEDRIQFIALNGSFHGRTLATLAATGQQKFHEPYTPLIKEFIYVSPNEIKELKSAISNKTCALILECVQGEGGIIPLDSEYVKKAEELCRENDALLIVDEIQTGMGRTGTFLASQQYKIKPDIVTIAKAFAGGIPAGALLATEEVGSKMDPGSHGSTFGGNHIACAAAYYVVKTIFEKDLIKRNAKLGAYFLNRLNELTKEFGFVLTARGLGLMLGLVLDEKVITAKSVQKELLNRGFIVCSAGQNTVRFLPPYIIEEKHIDALIEELKNIFALVK
ncbi:MAG: acetylornithine/succinylornithine family transaminase [Eubacteriales bacterium]